MSVPGPVREPAGGVAGAGSRAIVGVAGSAALIAAITVAARLAGFGRVFAFSAAVGGGGCVGTAYGTANQLPNVLFEVVAGGALAGAVVPVLAGLLARGRAEDADQVASALLGWAVLVLTPLALLLALLARPLVDLLLRPGAGGECAGEAALGARMLVVFAPQVILYGVGIVLAGVLQSRRRFGWPAAAPLLSSLVVVGAYLQFAALADGRQQRAGWMPARGAELVLSAGTTLGVAALSLPLLWPVWRAGVRLRPTLRFPAGAATRVRSLAAAGLGALLAQQAAVVATLALASRVGGPGVINVVQFAQAVYLLPYAVLAVPLATAAFPRLSAQASQGDRGAFAATAAATTRLVTLVSLLGAALLVAAAPAVQSLFLGVDAVGGAAFDSLGAGLTALAPGLVGWSLVAQLSRVLYAAGSGRPAAAAAAAGWTVAVIASVLAVLGLVGLGSTGAQAAVIGLGVGSSTGMMLAGALLLRAVRRQAGPAGLSGVPGALVSGGLAALAGAGAGRLLSQRLPAGTGRLHAIVPALRDGAAVAVVTAVVFVAVLAVTDRRDLRAMLARARRRAGGGQAVGDAGRPGAGDTGTDERRAP